MHAVTGEQFDLSLETSSGGVVSATITQVAAGIRRLSVHGIDIVPPYDAGREAPVGQRNGPRALAEPHP